MRWPRPRQEGFGHGWAWFLDRSACTHTGVSEKRARVMMGLAVSAAAHGGGAVEVQMDLTAPALPATVRTVRLRADSASDQTDVLGFCAEGRSKRFGVIEFAIGVPISPEFREAVLEVPEQDWHDLAAPDLIHDPLATTTPSSGHSCAPQGAEMAREGRPRSPSASLLRPLCPRGPRAVLETTPSSAKAGAIGTW